MFVTVNSNKKAGVNNAGFEFASPCALARTGGSIGL